MLHTERLHAHPLYRIRKNTPQQKKVPSHVYLHASRRIQAVIQYGGRMGSRCLRAWRAGQPVPQSDCPPNGQKLLPLDDLHSTMFWLNQWLTVILRKYIRLCSLDSPRKRRKRKEQKKAHYCIACQLTLRQPITPSLSISTSRRALHNFSGLRDLSSFSFLFCSYAPSPPPALLSTHGPLS